MNHQSTIQAAIAGVIALGFAASTARCRRRSRHAEGGPGKVLRHRQGRARTTAARTKHAVRRRRAPRSTRIRAEWKYVDKGTCEKMGGKAAAPKA